MKIRNVLNSRAVGAIPLTAWPSFGRNSSVCVCIVGVGYVGESLLTEFAKQFDTIGYDVSEERIQSLQSKHLASSASFTTNASHLSRGTHFLVAVPTPLREDMMPDLHCLASALQTVFLYAQSGSCIVIESSIPVGTTRRMLGPFKDRYHCGMSPERIDPGRATPSARQIPKVISGLTPRAVKKIATLYGAVYETIVPVSKPEVAEMTKLYENCYRMVNIAYVNEVSDACLAHGIDPHEMIGAASTKPFGFQPFYPGLGVGGHCIPVNPFYLIHNNRRMRVLELATSLMLQRPVQQAARFHRLCLNHSPTRPEGEVRQPRILVVGLGFKAGHASTDGSPAIEFAQRLFEIGCERLAFYDPSKEQDTPWMEKLDAQSWNSQYVDVKFDGVAICNAHASIDLGAIGELQAALVRRYF
jgi:nucleotide sugar dehydrogenase